MPHEPLAFGPSSQYSGGTVTKETQGQGRSRSQGKRFPVGYCGLIWWTVVWYNLTVAGVLSVDVILSCFLGDFCYYGSIPANKFQLCLY